MIPLRVVEDRDDPYVKTNIFGGGSCSSANGLDFPLSKSGRSCRSVPKFTLSTKCSTKPGSLQILSGQETTAAFRT